MPDTNVRMEEQLEPLIVSLRGSRVILDRHLARIYGVATGVLNQAVKRNADRFPPDFAFRITRAEAISLKSQIVISNKIPPENQLLASADARGGSRKPAWVFTEHGSLMAANILRTERAVQMSIFVIRTFVRLREHAAANAAILKRLAEIDETLLQHDAALRDVYQKLQPLLMPPPQPPKRRIGF